ncbi:aldo/keto reductase [Treponema pectinovorum]|uniref:aldo/keto reductase n=1 Tax=Treponema pectinovorum TaxID=164 RepID=UPI0011C777CF|nr:aldo/keto reductase [Treponema pectinovorum]
MDYVLLGKSNLLVSRTALGAMALENIADDESATKMIEQAYEAGINFFDTARMSEESERRLGSALHGSIRKDIYVATKTKSLTAQAIAKDVELSLAALKTDYIDLYQLDVSSCLPKQGIDDKVFDLLQKLKTNGIIHHLGICTENFEIARELINSDGPWETLQYPFNMLCPEEVQELVFDCKERNLGFIAMQPLCGGVIQDIPLALGFFCQFDYAVPVWGAHSSEELRQILYFAENPPNIDSKFLEEIEKARNFFN